MTKKESVTVTAATTYDRLAWDAPFNEPTLDQLRADLPPAAARLMDKARRCLNRLDGVVEGVRWYGECWHWSIEYRTDHSAEPLALVIPAPHDLRLAVPLTLEFLRALPTSRLPRTVRDGLEMARESFDSRWGLWSLDSPDILDNLVDLIESKLHHLAKQAG